MGWIEVFVCSLKLRNAHRLSFPRCLGTSLSEEDKGGMGTDSVVSAEEHLAKNFEAGQDGLGGSRDIGGLYVMRFFSPGGL